MTQANQPPEQKPEAEQKPEKDANQPNPNV
jgi:hypothetical protein